MTNKRDFDADFSFQRFEKIGFLLIVVALGVFHIFLFGWNAFVEIGYEGGWSVIGDLLSSNLAYAERYPFPKFFPLLWFEVTSVIGERVWIIFLLSLWILTFGCVLYEWVRCKKFGGTRLIFPLLLSASIFVSPYIRIADYHIFSIMVVVLFLAYMVSNNSIYYFTSLALAALVVLIRPTDGIAFVVAFTLIGVLNGQVFRAILPIAITSIILVVANFNVIEFFQYGSSAKGVGFDKFLKVFLQPFVTAIRFIASNPSFMAIVMGLAYLGYWRPLLSQKFQSLGFFLVFGTLFVEVFREPILVTFLSFIGLSVTIYFVLFDVLERVLKHKKIWLAIIVDFAQRFSIMFVPLAYLTSSLLSSGGYIHELAFATTATMLIAVLNYKRNWFSDPLCRVAACACTLALTLSAIFSPFGWHSYASPKLFDRVFFNNASNSWVSDDLLWMKEDVCPLVSGSKNVYSIPWPFFPRLCGVRPWPEQIITFYDLTSPEKVRDIKGLVNKNPPEFIWIKVETELVKMHANIFSADVDDAFQELYKFLLQHHLYEMFGSWTSDGSRVRGNDSIAISRMIESAFEKEVYLASELSKGTSRERAEFDGFILMKLKNSAH